MTYADVLSDNEELEFYKDGWLVQRHDDGNEIRWQICDIATKRRWFFARQLVLVVLREEPCGGRLRTCERISLSRARLISDHGSVYIDSPRTGNHPIILYPPLEKIDAAATYQNERFARNSLSEHYDVDALDEIEEKEPRYVDVYLPSGPYV